MLHIELFGACFLDKNGRLVAQHKYTFDPDVEKIKIMFNNKTSRCITHKNVNKIVEGFGGALS